MDYDFSYCLMEEEFEFVGKENDVRWWKDTALNKEENWEDLQHESAELQEEAADLLESNHEINSTSLGKKSFFVCDDKLDWLKRLFPLVVMTVLFK